MRRSSDLQRWFGRAVRVRREALGLSQEGLAEVAGLHRTYVGAIERGERNVSLQNIWRLAQALRMTASDLLQHTERAESMRGPRSVSRPVR